MLNSSIFNVITATNKSGIQMGKLDEVLCRLCLATTNDESSKIVDGYTKEVLSILLLHKKLEEGDKNLLCSECSKKLFAAFDFKVTCLNTEDCIYPYIISEENSVLDLKEIYQKEKAAEHLNDMSEGQTVCRLCLQLLTSNFISLEEVDPDMIEMYIPEVNFCSTMDPVICEGCFKSLVRHSIFLKACSDTEEQIKCDGARIQVKTEEIEIKPEQQVEDSNLDEEINTTSNLKQTICRVEELGENRTTQTETKQLLFPYAELALKVYKCNQCDFGCTYKCDLVCHQVTHNVPLQVLKCEKCKYETDKKKNLKRHEIIHKDRSELSLFNCDRCPYVSPYKSVISMHQLRHKDASEVETFRCDECEYVTIFKSYLANHKVRHKSTSELKMFKCEECDFETKRKKCFVRHKLTHRDSGEVQMFKCDKCEFQTKHKTSYSTHQLKHMKRKEMQMFRCDSCEYETYRKVYLIRHLVTHKKASEVQMHKCRVCDFQSKHKCSVQRHQARH